MERLKLLREAHMMSQDELAEKLFLQQQCICNYELGIAEPDLETLIKMADLFHTTVDFLIGRDDENGANNSTDGKCTQMKLSNNEKALLEAYRNLSAESKDDVQTIIKGIRPL